MKITVEGDAKEIAALLKAIIQEQPSLTEYQRYSADFSESAVGKEAKE